jgi:hypothetical protein
MFIRSCKLTKEKGAADVEAAILKRLETPETFDIL